MAESLNFDWVPFYREVAQKLLSYKDKRATLVAEIKEVFASIGLALSKLNKRNDATDIDPFTVFGLFNKRALPKTRIKIMTGLAQKWNLSAAVPQSLLGIPVIMPLHAVFHPFEEDDTPNISLLWKLFEVALSYAESNDETKRAELLTLIDSAVNMRFNAFGKVTMGLYWIAPETYLNLDSRNHWYIFEANRLPTDFVKTLPLYGQKFSALLYLGTIEKIREFLKTRGQSFMKFSDDAYQYSEEVNAIIAGDDGNDAPPQNDGVNYWTYAPGENARLWDDFYKNGIMGIGCNELGDIRQYKTKEDIRKVFQENGKSSQSFKNDTLASWQFANEMKVGDIVFVKKGTKKILGWGIVQSDYLYDASRDESSYRNIRKVEWKVNEEKESPDKFAQKMLTKVTDYSEFVNQLKDLYGIDDSGLDGESSKEAPSYSSVDFLNEAYMDEAEYDLVCNLLERKQNIILQGAPGVGKTFIAKRLAYSIIGEKDESRVQLIQFHQSYSYEDFIMGYRPTESGDKPFEIKYGAFYDFCKKAEDDDGNKYFFIIDEINRGNISKIFGELFMLLEKDKHGEKIRLMYKNEQFTIPKNVFIIGMMNTADRSLAILDYALRRRFAFYEIKPAFESKGFKEYQTRLDNPLFNKLISCVKRLNAAIKTDSSLGKGFCIGHSYFCGLTPEGISETSLDAIIEYEIIPLLEEYWFDEPDNVNNWSDQLRNSIR